MLLCDYILPLAVAFVNTKNRIFAIIFCSIFASLVVLYFQGKDVLKMSETGEQMKKRRKQLNMSADELAEKLGV